MASIAPASNPDRKLFFEDYYLKIFERANSKAPNRIAFLGIEKINKAR